MKVERVDLNTLERLGVKPLHLQSGDLARCTDWVELSAIIRVIRGET
jgi:hypothetical protein